jgi:hypothetical protein
MGAAENAADYGAVAAVVQEPSSKFKVQSSREAPSSRIQAGFRAFMGVAQK